MSEPCFFIAYLMHHHHLSTYRGVKFQFENGKKEQRMWENKERGSKPWNVKHIHVENVKWINDG